MWPYGFLHILSNKNYNFIQHKCLGLTYNKYNIARIK